MRCWWVGGWVGVRAGLRCLGSSSAQRAGPLPACWGVVVVVAAWWLRGEGHVRRAQERSQSTTRHPPVTPPPSKQPPSKQPHQRGHHTARRPPPTPLPLASPPAAGDALLVAPVLKQGAQSVQVVLPGGGAWYSATDGAAIDASVEANKRFELPGEGGGHSECVCVGRGGAPGEGRRGQAPSSWADMGCLLGGPCLLEGHAACSSPLAAVCGGACDSTCTAAHPQARLAPAGRARTQTHAPPPYPPTHPPAVTRDSIPRYLRGGRTLPLRERARRSTAAAARDPLTLVVALDSRGQAQGELYLDDGRSYAFQRGQYAYRRFEFKGGAAGRAVEGWGSGVGLGTGRRSRPSKGSCTCVSGGAAGLGCDVARVQGLAGWLAGWLIRVCRWARR